MKRPSNHAGKPSLTPDEAGNLRQYLYWKRSHAQAGVCAAKEAKRFDYSGQSDRQLAYWSAVVSAIDWCLAEMRHCVAAPAEEAANES